MGTEKYRVHEVAKDFGLPTKTITEILTKYAAAPKNHMQVLTDHELSLIFDYLTQHNQISSIQTIFAEGMQEQPKEAPAVQQKPANNHNHHNNANNSNTTSSKPAQAKPATQQAQSKPQPQQPIVQQPSSRVPQKKIVDTRTGGDVNLAKYDERLETLGGQQATRMQRQGGGKEKFRNNQRRNSNAPFSNKRRQDEQERMRRLQLEIAKKAPLKVQIPDEISVGELASRMNSCTANRRLREGMTQ